MVGVPGRSKGCNTCRQRKKGCDQARPACGQCRKARISCSGYDRPRIFVNATGPSSGTGETMVPPIVTREDRGVTTNSRVTIPDSLVRAAYEVRYLELFWDAYIPLKKDSDKHMTYVNPFWTDVANELYPADDTLRTALLALGLATLGRRDGHEWMMNEGLDGYVRSLGQLSAQLRKPHGWRSDALLAASKALGLYELLHGPDNGSTNRATQAESWQCHSTGELALILRRSPEMYTQGHARLLFINSRMHLIIYCIMKRQRCPLSTAEWKSIPFRDTPKTYKDILLDVLADVPGLLENLDALRSPGPSLSRNQKRVVIIQECWRLDRELTRWFDQCGPQSHIQELMKRRSRNENPFLSDIAAAHIMGIYWTACILVYSTLRSVLRIYTFGREVPLPERTELSQYCRFVADIAEVLLHPSAGMFGMHSVPLPVGVSLLCLDSMEEGSCLAEKRRLLGLIDLERGRANGVRKFIHSSMSISKPL